MNPWVMAATAAMSMLQYNQKVKQAEKDALRDSVFIRGGQWSNMSPQGYEQPNFWGSLASGLTSGAMIDRQMNEQKQTRALIEALTKGQGRGGQDLELDPYGSADQQWGSPWAYRRPTMIGNWGF